MANSLNTKLTATLIVLALLICSTYGLVSYYYILKQQLADKQLLNRDLAINLVNELNWLPSDRVDNKKWSEKLDSFMSINPGIEIYILDLQGNIVVHSKNDTEIQRQQINVKPLQQHIKGDHMYPLIGQDPLALDLEKPFTVAQVPNKHAPQGYLYVVLHSQQQIEFEANKKANYYWYISMYLLAVSLTIAFVIAIVFFRQFTRRINTLTSVVSQFRESGFVTHDHYQLPLNKDDKKDEIGILNQSFDSMAKHMQRQFAQIQSADENRRNLLAGISHDLRTPLTALRGHLEILLSKSDHLKLKQKEKYLGICIKNTLRMGKMIEDIFQLSRLQSREIKLNPEAFSIEDLAQDVLLMLKPLAEQKGCTLSLSLSCKSIAFVQADIALIERVLENLLSNAIHHTDNGIIELIVEQESERVKISVKDNGEGIKNSDHQKITLPYYQCDSPSSATSKSGLGLAICENILALHQQKLNLISEPSKGSCFFFYLGSIDTHTI